MYLCDFVKGLGCEECPCCHEDGHCERFRSKKEAYEALCDLNEKTMRCIEAIEESV